MKRQPSRGVSRASVLIGFVLLGTSVFATRGVAEASGSPESVVQIQGFPNFAAALDVAPPDPTQVQAMPSTSTFLLTDDGTHLAFEWIANGEPKLCTGAEIVKYDLDTSKRLGYTCTQYYPPDGNTVGFQA